MSDIIELTDLTKVFPGGIVAVDNLSLSIKEGEFVTLLGPSGCGKTTTLRMAAGFEIPTAGRIFLAGEDVTEHPPYRRRVNTVFQDYALFPHMTVAENVGYGLRVAGVSANDRRSLVEEALGMVDLREKAGDRPNQLSGGQKQRVALARALIRKPKVLLLDEPLSALDAKLREAMQLELKHLHQKLGLTFVLVTHDQTEAMVMSDRIVVMDEGRIIQSGTPTELYDHPNSAYVANFLGNSNMITGRVLSADAGGVTVGFEKGEIRSSANGSSLSHGEAVSVAIRPEKATVLHDGETAPEGFNLLTGTVMNCLFQGNLTRIELQMDGCHDAVFHVELHLRSTSARATLPHPGAHVPIAIDPHNVSVFPADTSR